ncbi:MAG: M1 family metallopeptidase [Flavobacteriales bacterium]
MMSPRLFTLAAAVACAGLLSAQDAPFARYAYAEDTVPREHPVDMEHMLLEVHFDTGAGRVIGTVQHRFKVLRDQVDSLFFDGPGIRIKKASINGAALRYKVVKEGIWTYPSVPLKLAQEATIAFDYEATPDKGIYFIGWNDPAQKMRKEIWTQGQTVDNRYWFPCYDNPNDKLITETKVTMPKPYKVLSNGTKRAEKDNGDGTVTWHYAMTRPHSVYLVMLGIGEYAIDERTTKAGVPVHLWYYPDQADRVAPTYKYSTECIDFVAWHTGIPYPWESYSQIPVADFLYGAMENTTATVFGDFMYVDARGALDRTYQDVNVHELTHQWFGDMVTERNFDQHWLQESFATFYPKLFARDMFGPDIYEWKRRNEHVAALAAGEKDYLPVVSTLGGSPRYYPKGSAVLDMMMHVFGEEQYRRVIHHYLKKHAYGNVETNDLYQSFQDTLGLSPAWFFDEWLYRGGEPHFKVSWKAAEGGRSTRIMVDQVHPRNHLVRFFRMPVEFEVYYTDGSHDASRQEVNGASTVVDVPNKAGKAVSFVLFDPASYILKRLTFPKPFTELKAQALKAPHMIDRYDAVVALRDSSLEQKRALLIEVFGKEKFHVVKGEVVTQLANDAHADSRALMKKAMADPDVEVRRAAIKGMRSVPDALRAEGERMLADSSYDIVRTALEKLTATWPGDTKRYLEATKDVVGLDALVRTKWLEIAANAGDPKALTELVELISASNEFRTRQNAMLTLKALGHCDTTATRYLLDAATSRNQRLAVVAADVLRSLKERTAYRSLLMDAYLQGTWNERERGLLKPIFE